MEGNLRLGRALATTPFLLRFLRCIMLHTFTFVLIRFLPCGLQSKLRVSGKGKDRDTALKDVLETLPGWRVKEECES